MQRCPPINQSASGVALGFGRKNQSYNAAFSMKQGLNVSNSSSLTQKSKRAGRGRTNQ